ncbi:hypothetical protein ZWY2020_028210 [Hordeum vulgare]|nr:hypothetical protein ZWY2020_028210 [Hordeum vulgare]
MSGQQLVEGLKLILSLLEGILLHTLILKYIEKVTERTKDTGVSVRKRVINSIRDLCASSRNADTRYAFVEIISCVNDEESSVQVKGTDNETKIHTLSYVLVLQAFCIVDPTLCTPVTDPSQFAVTLQLYLKNKHIPGAKIMGG